ANGVERIELARGGDRSHVAIRRRFVRFDQIKRACRFTQRHRGDDDSGVAVVLQRIGEVDPADPEVPNADVVRKRALAHARRDLDAEGIIAEKDVADTGNEYARHAACSAPTRVVPSSSGIAISSPTLRTSIDARNAPRAGIAAIAEASTFVQSQFATESE